MNVKQLMAELAHYPGHMPVVVGGQAIEFVGRVPGSNGPELELLNDVHMPAGVAKNPEEELSPYLVAKLEERGLSIDGIEAEPYSRSQSIDLEDNLPRLVAQLIRWNGIKRARLRWEVQGTSDDFDGQVEHYIEWEGFESPDDIAGRIIREHDREVREQATYKRLKAKYDRLVC